MKPYPDILQEFEERNKHISGSFVVNDQNRIGHVIYEPEEVVEDKWDKFFEFRKEAYMLEQKSNIERQREINEARKIAFEVARTKYELENKKVAKVNGKPNKLGKSLGLKEEDKSDISKLKANVARERYELSCVPDFSKMSIAQAKTSESQTIDFDVMIEFCNWESYRSYTGEYWFETTIFQPYKKIFVSYSRRQISDENGYNFKNLKELIDYVDSWF